MKKLFFTTIALIAFSGTSIANIKEINNYLLISKSKIVILEEKEPTLCQDRAIALYERYIGNGPDDWDLFNHLMSACEV